MRDIKSFGDKLIYASGTELHVVDREPQFFSEQVSNMGNPGSPSSKSKEYRHVIHHVMNGHRREISCLDVMKGKPSMVASGSKDRKLIVWCFEVQFKISAL